MKFTCEHLFDASIEDVLAMYGSPQYLSKKYELQGLRDIKCLSSNFGDNSFAATYEFLQQNKANVPALAKKLMGSSDWLLTRQTDQWDVTLRTGSLEVVIEPFKSTVSIRCAMRLEANGTGCVNKMDWQVDCSVPLIGGKIAKFIAEDIEMKSAVDGDIARQLLMELSK